MENNKGITFSVMQYNMLGLCYAFPEWFPHCPPSLLHHVQRKVRIVQQFKKLNPDIITLQELDCIDYFRAELSKLGYECVYQQRPCKQDGCGIFYKSDRFQVCQTQSIEYNDGTSRIGLVATFSPKFKSTDANDEVAKPCICVGTTHLYWNDTYMNLLKAELVDFLSLLGSINKNSIDQRLPTILAGDFNSAPSSKVYAKVKQHELKFQSAYRNHNNADVEPPTCNRRAIDYIFYSTAHTAHDLKLVSVEDLPDLKTIQIPNEEHPSDHLPLNATFELHL
mmetsp:Transcript_2468/g.3252  ORF Transcript_2468/g.3252 Transcript_2468/m.3252 type:complete len:280 (+) Transcript_2468:578-1417(+)